ncbi:hypothetical protein BLNAU_3131 [Blattamonas nauphoetae]|uniref:Uncharacterized protein n=1 Tax=Blattamonas nauphoetae TaxID=2049346 RepID=A0ABQ9YD70_9EUKA|nr:hypothetical protein BLNAU_17946 [Blattamonas nauphoetae]KAK2961694.1 hypothetical protein BLNAU_3131 [Blattamonas nauphoetae]
MQFMQKMKIEHFTAFEGIKNVTSKVQLDLVQKSFVAHRSSSSAACRCRRLSRYRWCISDQTNSHFIHIHWSIRLLSARAQKRHESPILEVCGVRSLSDGIIQSLAQNSQATMKEELPPPLHHIQLIAFAVEECPLPHRCRGASATKVKSAISGL